MNNPAPLQATAAPLDLEDIHLPAAPGLWPPAIGWWLLLLITIGVLFFALSRFRRYRQRKKQIQKIQAALQPLAQQLKTLEHPQVLADINRLLRTLALMHFPRQEIAHLTGQSWLAFLDRSGQTQAFTQGAGQLLGEGPYLAQLPKTVDRAGLTLAIKKWVQQVTKKNKPLRPLYPTVTEHSPSGKKRPTQ